MKKKLADEIGKAFVRLHSSSKNKGDLISRKAVLDELEKWDWQDLYLPIHFKQILDDIPSADVRPNIHGHWGRRTVDNGFNADWVCSECGHRERTDFTKPNIYMNFCPNCGADMRGKTWTEQKQ